VNRSSLSEWFNDSPMLDQIDAMSPSCKAVRRLNVGCGPCATPGWINADLSAGDGIDVIGDLRAGLPLASESMDYIVAMHVLQDLPYPDMQTAVAELKRVLVPGGCVRLGLPDLDRAIRAYLAGDHAYFYVPDADATRIGTKLVTQIVWYGSVRTPFTFEYIDELLRRQAFTRIYPCEFGRTRSPYPEITALDNRPRESFFVEAIR
jgi:SAM-dependent methyltransferase